MSTYRAMHDRLVEVLGSTNVYYQPPENIKLVYPCIVFHRLDYDQEYADNITYHFSPKYRATVISKTPDHPAIEKLLTGRYTSFVSHYASDGLNHDIIDIYS